MSWNRGPPTQLRKEALRNWIHDLYDFGVFEPLRFDKSNKGDSFAFGSVIGLFATAAAEKRSLYQASFAAEWDTDPQLVPNGETVRSTINEKNIEIIYRQFKDSYLQLLHYLSTNYPDGKPRPAAIDDTVVPAADENEWTDEYSTGYREPSLKNVDYVHKYTLGGFIGDNNRIVFGVHPKKTDEYAGGELIHRVMRPPVFNSEHDISTVVADRGFVGAPQIDAFRAVAKPNFLILAKQQHEPGLLTHLTPMDTDGGTLWALETYLNKLKSKPNLYVIDRHPNERSSPQRKQRAYLTDMDIDHINPYQIKLRYRQRRRIEETIREIKYEFAIPTNNASPELAFYLFSISTLFYNLSNIINNYSSPKYDIPLGVMYNKQSNIVAADVLKAIQDVAFLRAKQDD
ncbi:IS4 transposase [Halanaeroarchaeum sp. HSR-CO]|uniref:transposase n=1 Tax=Halanaeroarchaeum sp. HSR-CO TaxID=2866382 RepID=UPI00217D803A|nr:transposase [Halanaeroarchaeum sp. HSR-CO]UWG47791.1 IS4 transposase [Halanaeroarchaeum sp. HSR-CO]